MKNSILFATLFMFLMVGSTFAQTQTAQFYNVKSGQHGNGLRFWNSDLYKIHMGNLDEYHYGPVTNYSIKFNMNNASTRGWTWGVAGETPTAALNTQGNFQVAGWMKSAKLNVQGGGVVLDARSSSTLIGQFIQSSGSSRDAKIKVRGSRNACTTCDIASIELADYDSNESGNKEFLMAKISGGMETVDKKKGYLRFYTNQGSDNNNPDGKMVENMRITSRGKVGIGTDDPEGKLDVRGVVRTEGITSSGRVNITATTDANSTSSSGALQIGGTMRLDGNEIITSPNTALHLQFDNNEDLIVDDKTLYVDASANRVGIGTNTPEANLAVHSSQFKGGIYSMNEDFGNTYLPNKNGWSIIAGHNVILRTNDEIRLRIASNGNIGIGPSAISLPQYDLDVDGTIRAAAILVEEGWGDYVFNDDYQLPTLQEEEKHIKAKGHLLGFESEKDMAGQIQLGDVTKRQQVKIEEMMLHLIELNKQNERLQAEITTLKNQIDEK